MEAVPVPAKWDGKQNRQGASDGRRLQTDAVGKMGPMTGEI